ncbi:methylated-DNA--[protein]-cysteine S-methyltransferase [Azonexus hydrophilus]|uniref:Methylated-DNA--[protein]-cysteine S-methyltransferase n=1 Tax=Azonexus hydrophilus TaxID=418702 RepID=A0ABZ2XJK6_9RHOO|nr:methylated-DNA--[protein]-cysteine S-methyltransferase [Azonexus hydrophilus]
MTDYQAIVVAPGFCLGICCDADEITGIDFLEPRPALAPTTPLAAEAARQLQAYLRDPASPFSLPLKPAGTSFQRRVWEQIAAIPGGRTETYGQLAKALHNAPRAIGQACGANPYPVVVPCHRVVASHGGLGGFARERGGFLLEVKRWLLQHENAELAIKTH